MGCSPWRCIKNDQPISPGNYKENAKSPFNDEISNIQSQEPLSNIESTKTKSKKSKNKKNLVLTELKYNPYKNTANTMHMRPSIIQKISGTILPNKKNNYITVCKREKFNGKFLSPQNLSSFNIKIQPSQFEVISEVWVIKDIQLIIKVNGLWGYLDDKGEIMPCCILIRIGNTMDKFCLDYKNMETDESFKITPDVSGPLFFATRIEKEVLNTFTKEGKKIKLKGELEFTLLGGVILKFPQILKKLEWDEIFVDKLFKENEVNFLTEKEKNILIYINLLCGNPQKFLDLFFLGEFNFLKGEDFENEEEKFLIANENLTKYAQSIIEGEDSKNQIHEQSIIKIISLNNLISDLEINIMTELIRTGDYDYILSQTYNYIGIKFKIDETNDSYNCVLILADSLV
ncbi:MAG: hypothetical protein MJ252_09205 [archaeon]|nr:hypothetical protein [archaeon]